MWLSESGWESVPFCLTFVRGATERQVFARFGADPDAAVPSESSEPDGTPAVRVARSGDWLVGIETNIPPQGVRPETLRRLSVGAEAVALYQDIGKLNHELGYAADGDVVSAVTTTVPPYWSGRDPGRLAVLGRELGLGVGTRPASGPTDLEILLTMAERTFGLSLDEEIWDQPWPIAPILPVPDDLPPPPPPGSPPVGIGDPVIDLYLARASRPALAAVLGVRTPRLIAEAGLGAYPDLVAAVQLALAEGPQPEAGAVGRTLRKLARARKQAETDLAVRRADLPAPEDQVRARVRSGEAAWALRFVLAGRLDQALANDLLLQRSWHPETWRDQALADFSPAIEAPGAEAPGIEVPASELQAAERTWRATRDLPDPASMIGTEPVRQHLQQLLDAGLSMSRIAELSEMEPGLLDLIRTGRLPILSGLQARKIMVIAIP